MSDIDIWKDVLVNLQSLQAKTGSDDEKYRFTRQKPLA
jgi:hypothetical protein